MSACMPKDNGDSFLSRSTRSFQENVEKSGSAAVAGYTMTGAIILLGGIGYALDRWWSTSPWLLFVGLLAGLAVGFYELARTIWRR